MPHDPSILQNIGQSNVGTSTVNAFNNALIGLQNRQKQQAAEAQHAQTNQLLSNLFQQPQVIQEALPAGQDGPPEQPQASQAISQKGLLQLSVQRPELFEQINKNLGLITDQQKKEAADFAFDVTNTPFDQRREKIIQRIERLQSQGRDASDTRELLNKDQVTQDNALNAVQIAALPVEKRVELASGAGGLASAKTEILEDGSVIQALPDGSVQVRNPQGQIVTGQQRAEVLERGRKAGLDIKQAEANIAIQQARGTAQAKNKAERTSAVTKELSDRNRGSARAAVGLNRALKLASQADQGLTGSVKLQLAKVLPNLDVSNEAALSQSLQQLALDQLQNFKGPTTDFEFGVTQSIAGQLGDPKSANLARIKALQRAEFFNQEEFKQFQRHVRSGGDPDAFSFNFGAPVKTKKGVFTLQDIQDTAVQNNLSIDETIKRLNR